MLDGKYFGQELSEIVKGAIGRSVEPFSERLKALEEKLEMLPVLQDKVRGLEDEVAALKAMSERLERVDRRSWENTFSLTKLAPLAARIAEVEGESLRYGGVWDPKTAYGRSVLTTHAGAGWIATRATVAGDKPGTPGGPWTLAVKSSRPGRT